jgi:hypothetical protein
MRNVHPYWQGERRRGSRDIIKEEEEWSGRRTVTSAAEQH